MQHSILIRLFKKIFDFTKRYYKFSVAGKIINRTFSAIRNVFIHSFIYRFFASGNKNVPEIIAESIIGKIESILHKILKLLHTLYNKGIRGSSVLKFGNKIKKSSQRTKIEFISFLIIGVVVAFNLLSFVNKSIYVFQIYVSAIALFLTVNVYFMDIHKVYQNSFVKRIVDSFIKM